LVVGGCISTLVPDIGCQLLVVDPFSPLLVPSSDDKNEFRQEVAYNEFDLRFNYINSSYSIATMSRIDMLTNIEKNC
jgi:hypothetical protein